MNAQIAKNKQGFTIIEVVLVLAIAALIFLMVFIALPALQRNQRDTQRKNDIGRFVSAVNAFQSNNRGALPDEVGGGSSNFSTFKTNYLTKNGDSFEDPSIGSYNVSSPSVGTGATPSSTGDMYYIKSAKCGLDGQIVANSGSSRSFAVSVKVEGGTAYCQNN